MKVENIKETFEKIPINFLLVLFVAYLGFTYFSFESDELSQKKVKQKEIAVLRGVNTKLESKYRELNLFVKSLEKKKIDLRKLAMELQDVKAVLTENIDVPGFMKLVTTEAKRLNFSVLSLKPKGSKSHGFYAEESFDLTFRGVFVQFAQFLDRIANLTRIIQIENLKITSVGSNSGRFVILEGFMELKVFKYLGSVEDLIGKSEGESSKGGAGIGTIGPQGSESTAQVINPLDPKGGGHE